MKKLVVMIITGFVLMFGASAFAETCVNYNSAGRPVSISFGSGPSISYATYSNNLMRNGYANTGAYYRRHPHMGYRGTYRNQMGMGGIPYGGYRPQNAAKEIGAVKSSPSASISRFDRRYTPKSRTSYTRNGITYYN